MKDIEEMIKEIIEYQEDNRIYRLTVKYGMHKIGNQEPYFSITADLDRKVNNNKYVEDSCGCLHELIEEKLPHLKPLIDFHLWSQSGIPMHYIANAIYWYKGWLGDTEGMFPYGKLSKLKEREKAKSILIKHILLKEDEVIHFSNVSSFKLFLENRLPRIQELFHRTMRQFNVKYIEG